MCKSTGRMQSQIAGVICESLAGDLGFTERGQRTDRSIRAGGGFFEKLLKVS